MLEEYYVYRGTLHKTINDRVMYYYRWGWIMMNSVRYRAFWDHAEPISKNKAEEYLFIAEL